MFEESSNLVTNTPHSRDWVRLENAPAKGVEVDQEQAQKLARRLAIVAHEIAPERNWTVEDLRQVFDLASTTTPTPNVRVSEGKYFRKRMRELCNQAEIAGAPFGCVILTLAGHPQHNTYTTLLEAVLAELTPNDWVFLFKRRFAVLLHNAALVRPSEITERTRALLKVGAAEQAIEEISSLVYPDANVATPSAMLDWAEDCLRS